MEHAQFFSFFDMPFRPLNANVSSRLMAGKELMFVEHKVKKGHTVVGDCHINEQLTLVLSGKVKFTVGKEVYILKQGDALLISSGVVHNCDILEDSVVMEVFSPPREEWIQKISTVT